MPSPTRAATVAVLALVLATPAAAQTLEHDHDAPSIRSAAGADVLRDLPLGENVYALLETTQPEVIADRFNSAGLNVGGPSRTGGFLGSWSQTLFRIGEIDVSDPIGSGASLLFPSTSLWQQVVVDTGLMPADVTTSSLAVTLAPRQPTTEWVAMVNGSSSGGGLAASPRADRPPPVARLNDWAHGTAFVAGPLRPRVGIAVGAEWTRGSTYQREELAASAHLASGFAHIAATPTAASEWRTFAWVQRVERPFDHWQTFREPSAATRDSSVHLQSTWERRLSAGRRWRAYGAVTQRLRTIDLQTTSTTINRLNADPIPELIGAVGDTTVRRWTAGGRMVLSDPSSSRHAVETRVELNRATASLTNGFSGSIRELVNGIPARTWTYITPGAESLRAATTITASAADRIRLSPTLDVDAGLRLEAVAGHVSGGATSVRWIDLLPRAVVRWEFATERHVALVLGYRRSASRLNLDWLSYGDPSAATGSVARSQAPNVLVARVGPGTGGDPTFVRVDPDLERPVTDEFVVGVDSQRSRSVRLSLTGIARRETNLLGVVNTGVPASSYSTVSLPDAGQDLVNPVDDRPLTVYNRRPESFGRDQYVLTNPRQEAATVFALKLTAERTTERMFLLFGATASVAHGSAGNRGYGPLENDQDQLGELFTNPNAATYARGRLFSDRAFTIKWTTLYRFPGDFRVGAIARYQDGQPFSRMVVVPDLNQGAEAVRGYPNAGSRFTFTGTLDLRLQKGLSIGGERLDAVVDLYNLFTRSNEVEEYVVTGPAFRTPTAIQPPRAIHLGLRLAF